MTLSWGLDSFEALWPSVSLAITILVFAALWRVSIAKANCGVVDLYWSFGFAVIAWLELVMGGRWDAYRLGFIALVTAWALRLGWHLVDRHRTARGEDARYRLMRERNGPGWPNKSFWMVFMLQAVILWIIAAPIHMVFEFIGSNAMQFILPAPPPLSGTTCGPMKFQFADCVELDPFPFDAAF